MRHSHDLVPTLPASLCPALCSIIRNRGGGRGGGWAPCRCWPLCWLAEVRLLHIIL